MYYSPKSAFVMMQPWRAVSNFFYFGPISLDYVFHLFFL
jgi:Derlin-2/3